MKALVFCNNKEAAQIVFELIRKRVFAGIVVPATNTELINVIKSSGYIADNQMYTPDLEKEEELIDILNNVKPDVCLTLTFPLKFSSNLLKIPKLGFYNFHFGRLPEFRSADPIFWQIRKGVKMAGLYVHKMVEKIDAGPILFKEDFPINYIDTYGSLLHKSAALTCIKIDEIIQLIEDEDVKLTPQSFETTTYYPKPGIADVSIDWQNMDMEEITATVNACNPWNKGALTYLEGQEIKILQVTPANIDAELPDQPGLVFHSDDKQGAFVVCKGKQLIRIDAIYTELGYVFGGRLANFGINNGKILTINIKN